MVGVTVFLWRESRKRWGDTHWEIYGPLYLSALGGILMLADPLRHVLQDKDVLTLPMYRHDCGSETIKCLSVAGWVITIGCTYVGILLLVVGTMWNADLIGKLRDIRDKWREIRNGAAANADYQRV